MQIDLDGSSQFAFIAVERQQGRRNIFCSRGARRPFCIDARVRNSIANAAALLLNGGEPVAALAAARFARTRKIPVILDGGSLNERILELCSHCDHLVVSQRFAEQLITGNPAEAVDRLLRFGAKAAVVTLGSSGCVAREQAGPLVECPAFAADVVDTTGCGDVFHGGYAHGLLSGLALPERLRFASVCAALKACSIGGRQGIPSLDRVERALASRD